MNCNKILIIEDDDDIREGIRILLESKAFEILEAKDGLQGLALLDDMIDLVILNVMMPGISGILTCQEIRKKILCPDSVSFC